MLTKAGAGRLTHAAADHPAVMEPKIGILFANLGTPDGTDYWTFDCRFGASAEVAEKIFTSEINKHIDAAAAQELPEFYVEILARACQHKPRLHDEAAD